jgi:CheY-like chemotaxis protein
VRADEKRVRQILLNLLSNAVKFTDRGKVVFSVGMSPEGRVRFEVQDTGCGIEEHKLESIFTPFEQAGEMQRRLGGTGLGLAISRQFARLMGSDIRVESQVGKGSRFWFELVLQVVESGTEPQHGFGVIGYEGARRKILVVDDVAENRAVMIDMLSLVGFDVSEAVSGEDGLEKALLIQPDLILMDLVMPGMDGLETTRRLRALPGLREVPVIAISANTSLNNEENSLTAGFNAFLPKPIDYGSLVTRIADLLHLRLIGDSPTPVAAQDKDADRLALPPEELLDELYRLARLGNMNMILQWVDRVEALDERYRPFANHLRVLAEKYHSKAILTLAKRYLDKALSH